MKQDFDNIAKEYDETFTHTQIGKYQRDLVYGFLQTELIDFKEKTILEINGGTGEDAIWLAQKGAAVTCTDISEEMVEVAKQKAVEENQSNVVFKQLDITQISNNFNDQKFDVIFSNFGGLNCLTEKEFKQFLNDAHKILNPNGLRFEDEFVRHKALDLLGDLYLGGPILGRVTTFKSGHGLNHDLLMKLYGTPTAWKFTTMVMPDSETEDRAHLTSILA